MCARQGRTYLEVQVLYTGYIFQAMLVIFRSSATGDAKFSLKCLKNPSRTFDVTCCAGTDLGLVFAAARKVKLGIKCCNTVYLTFWNSRCLATAIIASYGR